MRDDEKAVILKASTLLLNTMYTVLTAIELVQKVKKEHQKKQPSDQGQVAF